MFSRLLPLLLLAVPPALASASPQLRLLHRIFHPSLPAAPFSERATLHILGSGPAAETRLVPSETFSDDLLEYASAAEGLKGALYQVALEHPGDADQTHWSTSSVLAVSPSWLRLSTGFGHTLPTYGPLRSGRTAGLPTAAPLMHAQFTRACPLRSSPPRVYCLGHFSSRNARASL